MVLVLASIAVFYSLRFAPGDPTGAALSRDYPVVMAGVMLAATLTLITNLLIDLAHGAIDPRVRMGER